jgi:hypothetical protein
VGITAHQVPSVYHPGRPTPASGRMAPARAGAAPDPVVAIVAAGAAVSAVAVLRGEVSAGADGRRMTSASTSISLRAPVLESTIQNKSIDATVWLTRPRWNSLPLCHASISSPTDSSELEWTRRVSSAAMACPFPLILRFCYAFSFSLNRFGGVSAR